MSDELGSYERMTDSEKRAFIRNIQHPKPDPISTLRSVLRQLEGNHATWKAIADQYEADSLQVRAIVYRECADALAPIIADCKAALGDKP